MDGKRLYQTFCEFNRKYFWSKLDKVKVAWSNKMTLCAGKTYLRVRGKKSSCTIRLSWPLLSQRPQQDTINTLLHEMIHAYFNVTRGITYREAHGPNFRKHMARINSTVPGAKVTISHNFRKEVNNCRVHVYRCEGPCRFQRPNFGILRRAVARPPGPTDRWWEGHKRSCGGTFKKVQGSAVTQLDAQKQASSYQSNSSLKHTKNINSRTSKPIHKPLKPIVPKAKKVIIPKYNSRPFEKKHQNNTIRPNIKSVTEGEPPIIQIDLSEENDVYEFTDSPVDGIKPNPSKNKPLIIPKKSSHRFEKKSLSNKVKPNTQIEKSLTEKNTPIQVNFTDENNDHEVLDDPLERIRKKYSNPKKSILVDFNEVSHNANGSTLVEGDINFMYICKNPKIINIEKYMNNMIESISKAKTDPKSDNFVNMDSIENNFVSGNINYNYQTKSNLDINKYLKKYKQYLDLNEMSYDNQNKLLNNKSKFNDDKYYDDKTNNQNNNSHKNINFINNQWKEEKHSTNQSVNSYENINKCLDFGQILICPNCDKDILEVEFREHLSYCLDPEDEDSDDDGNDDKSSHEVKNSDDDDNGDLLFSLPQGFMKCPACMEPVKENDIMQHMDLCLEWMSEEF